MQEYIKKDTSAANEITSSIAKNKTDITNLSKEIEQNVERLTVVEANSGVNEYSLFDTAFSYSKGDILRMEDGSLIRLTADYVAGSGEPQYEPWNLVLDTERAKTPDNMGYVILRKDLSFAEQVTKENTIYEIRYDFDLGRETVTIPSGCVLKFEGGVLKNGIINCNDTDIRHTGKIFDNIKFDGDFIYNGIVNLEWYVDKYPTNVLDKSIDNTSEIKQAFESGAVNIKIPTDKFLHLTETIKITKIINIVTDNNSNRYIDNPTVGDSAEKAYYKYSKPCLFSYNIVTMFRYNLEPRTDESVNVTDVTLSVGNICLYVATPYTDLSGKETPVVEIKTNGANIWGINLDCDVKVRRRAVEIENGGNTYVCPVPSYTAFSIYAKKGYATYTNIRGNIYGTYYGVRVSQEEINEGNWATQTTIWGDTMCCIGGEFNGGSPVFVYGSHQPITAEKMMDLETGYFKGIVHLYGYVWDCGMTRKVYNKNNSADSIDVSNVQLPLRLAGNIEGYYNSVPPKEHNALYSYGIYPSKTLGYKNWYKDEGYSNLLEHALTSSNIISDFTYKCDGVDILADNSKVINGDNLFNRYNYDEGYAQMLECSRVARFSTECNSINISFKLWSQVVYPTKNLLAMLFRLYGTSLTYTIIASESDSINGSYTEYKRYTGNGSYYTTETNYLQLRSTKNYIRVDINIEGACRILPTIIIPASSDFAENVHSVNMSLAPKLLSGKRIGANFYAKDKSLPMFWNGTKWLDALGQSIGTNYIVGMPIKADKYIIRCHVEGYGAFLVDFGDYKYRQTAIISFAIEGSGSFYRLVACSVGNTFFAKNKIRGYRNNNNGKEVIEIESSAPLTYNTSVMPIGTTIVSSIETIDASEYDSEYCTGLINGSYSDYAISTYDANSIALPPTALGTRNFDTTLKAPTWWDGSRWVCADGYVIGKRSGTTDIRTVLPVTSNDAGLMFFDIDLGKVVVYNGSAWVNIDGSALS